jgi:hypothetical protein
MKSNGSTEKKPVVDPSGDQIDVPKPKAKDDPHTTNKDGMSGKNWKKEKTSQPQVKESAVTSKYDNVKKVKGQYVFDDETTPQVDGEAKFPIKGKSMYNTKDGVEQVKEYLDNKGKLVTKPSEEAVARYSGPQPNAPAKNATKGKNWSSEKNDGTPSPYQAPGMDITRDGPHDGLGNMGGTKYEPDTTSGDSQYVPGGKSSSAWKTENFLNKTGEMGIQEFTKYMLESCACGSENVVAIKQLAQATCECPKSMEFFVYEMNKNGGLGALLEMMMNHQEMYAELNRVLADDELGESRCNSLARAMNEAVGPPWGKDSEEEDLHPDDDDEDEDMDNEDMDEDDMDHDDEMGDDSDGDVDGDEEFDGEDSDADDEDMGDEPDGLPDPSAGGNLLGAMKRYMHMKKMMGKY